jgi:hypothetical protein
MVISFGVSVLAPTLRLVYNGMLSHLFYRLSNYVFRGIGRPPATPLRGPCGMITSPIQPRIS